MNKPSVNHYRKIPITLLRVIPTMAFNSSHLTFYLAYLSGIPSGMSSDILSGISSDFLSGISSDFPSGISSDILSGISSDILSGISFDILSGISSDILSGILSGISSDILSGISFDILFGILYGFACGRWGPVEVRQGPQCSNSRRLKSGEAHSARELAVEVWRGPLRSRAGRWGPATTTAIETC